MLRYLLFVAAATLLGGYAEAREFIPASACRPLTRNLVTTGQGAGLFIKGIGSAEIACPVSQPVNYYRVIFQDGDGIGPTSSVKVELLQSLNLMWNRPPTHYPPSPACSAIGYEEQLWPPPAFSYTITQCFEDQKWTSGSFGYFHITLTQGTRTSQPVKGTGFFGIKTMTLTDFGQPEFP